MTSMPRALSHLTRLLAALATLTLRVLASSDAATDGSRHTTRLREPTAGCSPIR